MVKPDIKIRIWQGHLGSFGDLKKALQMLLAFIFILAEFLYSDTNTLRWKQSEMYGQEDYVTKFTGMLHHVLECLCIFLVHAALLLSALSVFRHQVQVLCCWRWEQLAGRHPAETPSLHYHYCSGSGTLSHKEEVWKVKYEGKKLCN